MKRSIFLATCALACSAAFAQAPTSPASPASPTSPAAIDAPAGAATKPGAAMPMGAGGPGMGMHGGIDMKAMDANGDGMISKKEFDSHHEAMWKKMKSKNGMVSIADMEAMMQGGRN
jgi:hypothetical protein